MAMLYLLLWLLSSVVAPAAVAFVFAFGGSVCAFAAAVGHAHDGDDKDDDDDDDDEDDEDGDHDGAGDGDDGDPGEECGNAFYRQHDDRDDEHFNDSTAWQVRQHSGHPMQCGVEFLCFE